MTQFHRRSRRGSQLWAGGGLGFAEADPEPSIDTFVEVEPSSERARELRQLRRIQRGVDVRVLHGRQHGTHATYAAGCHCDTCTDGETAYQRARREARKVSA